METLTPTETSIKGQWEIDPIHSNLNFTVDHLVISQVTGSFENYSGNITSEKDDLTEAKIDFKIEVDSLSTNNEMRDNHLKSDDFFNAAEFPHISFSSTKIEKTSEASFDINGKLTIRDVTRDVTFKAKLGGTAVDGYGNTKLGMRVSTTLNRFDYKLKWNQLTEAGGMTVGKEVDINAQLQFAKK